MNEQKPAVEQVVKALRWLAKDTEFVFAAEQLNTAADLLESQAAEIACLTDENSELRGINAKYLERFCELDEKLAEAERRERAAVGIVMTVDEYGEPFQFEHYKCPGCKNILSQRLKGSKVSVFTPKFCPDCGQKLD